MHVGQGSAEESLADTRLVLGLFATATAAANTFRYSRISHANMRRQRRPSLESKVNDTTAHKRRPRAMLQYNPALLLYHEPCCHTTLRCVGAGSGNKNTYLPAWTDWKKDSPECIPKKQRGWVGQASNAQRLKNAFIAFIAFSAVIAFNAFIASSAVIAFIAFISFIAFNAFTAFIAFIAFSAFNAFVASSASFPRGSQDREGGL